MSDDITIAMSREQALRAGLLACRCGHPPNNHHRHGKRPCAHCECKSYNEKPRYGRFVAAPSGLAPASIRRLKARISRIFIDEVTTYDRLDNAIDAWRKAEAKRSKP